MWTKANLDLSAAQEIDFDPELGELCERRRLLRVFWRLTGHVLRVRWNDRSSESDWT